MWTHLGGDPDADARSGLPGVALPRRELVAGLGTLDHAADEPAAPDGERREHELADLALDGGASARPGSSLAPSTDPRPTARRSLPARVCPGPAPRGKFGSLPSGRQRGRRRA